MHLAHASVHGHPSGAPVIDVDLDDAELTALVAPPRVTVDMVRGRMLARSLGGREAHGDLEAHLETPSKGGGPVGLHGSLRGAVETIAGRIEADFDTGVLDAVVDVPAAAPEQVRAVLPAWPVDAPVAVHVEARGAIPHLDVRAHASLDRGTLDLAGPVTIVPLGAKLRVDARAIDPHGIVPSAPEAELTAAGDVSVASSLSGAITVRIALGFARGRVVNTRTPPAELTGEVTRGPPPGAELSANAKLSILEPGLVSEVTARLVPKHGSFAVAFEGDVTAVHLEDVQLLRGVARGHATAHVLGTFDLHSGSIDARLTTTSDGLALGSIRVATLQGEAHASGPIANPSVTADVVAEGLAAGPVHLSAVQARATLDVATGALKDLDVRVDEDGQEARLRAGLVHISAGEVRLDDASVEGFGEPFQASIRGSATSLYLRAAAGAIDLAQVARFAHVPGIHGGRMSVDAEATVAKGAAEGRIVMDVADGAFATLHGVNSHVDVTLRGRQVTGVATARVGDIGSVHVASQGLEIGGSGALHLASWRRAWGAVDVDGHIDLPKLVATFPPGTVPFDEVRGALDVKVRLERDSESDVTPEVEVNAKTSGLALFGTGRAGRWRVSGIDPGLHTTVDGQTGATAVNAHLTDAMGDILTMSATSTAVPYATFFLGGDLPAALRAMTFDAHVDAAPRPLESLPAALGVSAATGQFQASVAWQGSVLAPTIDVTARLTRGSVDPRAFSLPLDLTWSSHYDGTHADAKLQAQVRDRQVIDASASLAVRAPDVLAGLGGADVPWTASARAKLDELPLQGFAVFDDRQVRGRASGEVSLDALHDDARAHLALTFDGLRVVDIPCKAARLEATIDGHAMSASARLEQEDGYVEAKAHAGARWGRAMVPGVDASRETGFSVSARQFRAALLLPFVSRLLSDLDGRIDGDASLAIDPARNVARPQGTLTFRDGSFELNSLGGEFTGVSAKLILTPDGIFRLEDVKARSLNGALAAAMTGRLDGLAFGGARATLRVPRTSPLPIVFDGVKVGAMDGDLEATFTETPGRKQLDVDVDVPTLHMQLPPGAAHDVQTLGDLEGVRTGFVRPEGFVAVPLDPPRDEDELSAARKPIQITVKLGKDVEVKRTSGGAGQPDLAVTLEGEPVLTIADRARASGQIRLVRGNIGVGGKPFEIEKGTVTFVGDDPTNPQVVLSAGWTAQDGTRVTADFVGPLRTGKVTLHADPAPPGGENGILALLLFGTSDQGSTGSSANGAAPAAGLGGGMATAPINQGINGALDKFGLGGGVVTTKVDTSQANPRPEVELQIARDISLEVAWVLGLPPPGMPDSTLVTFNWRFLRKWSLLTTVGNAGTSILDVVWQHRY
jgi:translocation and assembly module TamB